MKSAQLYPASPYAPLTLGPSGWWLGAGLALAAVVVIAIAIYVSAPPANTRPMPDRQSSVGAQSVPSAAAWPTTAHDAVRRMTRDELLANGAGLSLWSGAVSARGDAPSVTG